MLFCRKLFILVAILFSQSICNGDVAKRLTQRYNDKRMKCVFSKKTHPSYECSGLMIRAVDPGLKHAWSLKAYNKEKSSVSLAFLRKDTPFHKLPHGYNNGFIIYPHSKTPRKKNKYDVLCAFPVYGHTYDRGGRHGCGKSPGDKTGSSGHCDIQRINSFKKWKSRYEHIMKSKDTNFVRKQCAFDTTKRDAATVFATFIEANSYLGSHTTKYTSMNNELVIRSWNEKEPKSLPIEAFFYILNAPGAYDKAMTNQIDFYNDSGEIVPVVGIRLPTQWNPKIYIKNKKSSNIVDRKNTSTIVKHKKPSTIIDRKNPSTIVEDKEPSTIVDPKNLSTIDEHKEPSTIVDPKNLSTIDEPKEPLIVVDRKNPSTIVDDKEPSTIVDPINLSTINEPKKPLIDVYRENPSIVVKIKFKSLNQLIK